MNCSLQLRDYLRARRDGVATEDAAELAGIGITEARLHDADEVKGLLDHIDTTSPAPALSGHNSGQAMSDSDSIKDDHLRLLVERIERLEEEKRGISDDIKDVYGEAKSTGYDVKTIRWAVRERKIAKDKRDEEQALRETYGVQLGLF